MARIKQLYREQPFNAIGSKTLNRTGSGSAFRRVAIEIASGWWSSFQDGNESPPVLDILNVMGGCDS